MRDEERPLTPAAWSLESAYCVVTARGNRTRCQTPVSDTRVRHRDGNAAWRAPKMTLARACALGGEGRREEVGQQGRGAVRTGDVERQRSVAEREANAELEEGAALVLAPGDGVDLAHPFRGRHEAEANAARQCRALHGVIGEAEQEGIALLAQVGGGETAGDGQ